MSNDNYPAGVTNAHPYFNPPAERAAGVECGADEALVVPAHAVKAELAEIKQLLDKASAALGERGEVLTMLFYRVGLLTGTVERLEQEREYECPFHGEIDLEESECARWVCPVCGNERETDNAPEERDPDYEYDHRGEGR